MVIIYILPCFWHVSNRVFAVGSVFSTGWTLLFVVCVRVVCCPPVEGAIPVDYATHRLGCERACWLPSIVLVKVRLISLASAHSSFVCVLFLFPLTYYFRLSFTTWFNILSSLSQAPLSYPIMLPAKHCPLPKITLFIYLWLFSFSCSMKVHIFPVNKPWLQKSVWHVKVLSKYLLDKINEYTIS